MGSAPDEPAERSTRVAPREPADDASRAVLGPAAAGVIAPTDALDPLELGPYQVVGSIGRGGMGEIYLARRRDNSVRRGRGRLYALKVLAAEGDLEDELVKMFIDEASIMAEIHHPNVLEVFQFGREGDRYFLAMEYLAGRPLVRVMIDAYAREQGLDVRLAATIAGQAARGLDAAHSAVGKNGQPLQVVHRDVSPQNLFLTWPGHTKVIDFGVARATERVAHTTAGQLKGKAAYMSPEQVKGQIVDRRSDVFSLGACLWEMAAGRRLFKRDNEWETMSAVVSGPILAPSKVRGVGEAALDRIVLRALERDPDKRYQTAAELAQKLEAFVLAQDASDPVKQVSGLLMRLYGQEAREEAALIEQLGDRAAKADDLDTLRKLSGISLRPTGLRDITVAGAPELMNELDHFGEISTDPRALTGGLVLETSEPKTNVTSGPDAVRRAVAELRKEKGYAKATGDDGFLGIDRRSWLFAGLGLVGMSALLTVVSVLFFRAAPSDPPIPPITPIPVSAGPGAAPPIAPAADPSPESNALELEPIAVEVTADTVAQDLEQALERMRGHGVKVAHTASGIALGADRPIEIRADALPEAIQTDVWSGVLLSSRSPGAPALVAVGGRGESWTVRALSMNDCPATARPQAVGFELSYGRLRVVLPYGAEALGRARLARPAFADRAELADLGVAFGRAVPGSPLVLCGRGLVGDALELDAVPVGTHRVAWVGRERTQEAEFSIPAEPAGDRREPKATR